MFESLSDLLGLPAHPLLVHLAVVLIPGAALAFLALSWRGEWRSRFRFVLLILAWSAAGLAVFTAESGEALQSPVRRAAASQGIQAHFGQHPTFGNLAEIATLGFALAVTAVLLLESRPRLTRLTTWLPRASYALAGSLALVSLVSVTLAGHSGAKLVWRDLGSFATNAPTPIPTASPGQAAVTPTPPAGALPIEMTEFRFDPPQISVAAGSTVIVLAGNKGKVYHNLLILDLRIDTKVVLPGASAMLTFIVPSNARTLRFICSEEGHEEEGMVGEIIVE